MRLKHKNLFWILALLSAFCFDQLFWENPLGINAFFFVLLALLAGLIPFWFERIPIPWTSYLLLVPVGFFSLMIAFRAEPFTTAANILITLATLILFAMTLQSGAWKDLTLQQTLIQIIKFLLNLFSGGILFFLKIKSTTVNKESEDQEPEDARRSLAKRATPFLRGILITLPVILLLTLLLAQADPVFNQRISALFSWLQPENFGEIIFRLVYVLIIAYGLLSTYYFALVESRKEGTTKDLTQRISLGFIEALILLGSINLLFLSFVTLQITYLFGGTTNISTEGFTYAEYARRGFFELLAVAVISLLVFYVVSALTKRETPAKRWTFSGLGLFLVIMVGIILASAYIRLSLYEDAYGFTRLRTLTHIFIIWTGLLLVGVAVLELLKKMDRLALVLIIFIFGFGIILNLLNVDNFIVNQNVQRALATPGEGVDSLDSAYLNTLSADSVPALVNYFNDPGIGEALNQEIGAVLACWAATHNLSEPQSWFTTHFSRSRAFGLLDDLSEELEEYGAFQGEGWFVKINGEIRSCYLD